MKITKPFKQTLFALALFTVGIVFPLFSNNTLVQCEAPSNFTATINGTDASLSWDPAAGANSYEVGYFNQNDGSTMTATTSATSYTFLNLTPGIYQFWVRSLCDEDQVSDAIIDMEEIDGAIPEILDDFYNCLCDEFFDLECEDDDFKAQIDWNTEDEPCVTQYHFQTNITKINGEEFDSETTFSYGGQEIESLINDCIDENIPLIDGVNESEDRKYIVTDGKGKEMYELIFEEGQAIVKWNETNVESYTFNFSNCVFCDTEEAEKNSDLSDHTVNLEDQEVLTVQPNPFTNTLKVKWIASSSFPTTIKIYRVSGELIHAQTADASMLLAENYLRLDTQTWPSGLYFIQVNNGERNSISKVLKQK